MQGAITTVENVIKWVELNKTPYWRLFSGAIDAKVNFLVGSYFGADDMEASLKHLKDVFDLFNTTYGGTFNMLLNKSNDPKDNSGKRTNITLGTATGATAAVNGLVPYNPGISKEELKAEIEAAVKARENELRREYKHKAEIDSLKAEIQGIKEEQSKPSDFQQIKGFATDLLNNPIVIALVTKSLGIGGLPEIMQAMNGMQAQQQTDNTPPSVQGDGGDAYEEKINNAIDDIEETMGNADEVLAAVAKFVKQNPQQAKMFFNQVQTPVNYAE